MSESAADIEKQLAELRGAENFIGFSAFDLFLDDDESNRKDGVLKISRHNINPETGFLKFTFIVDVYGDKLIRKQVLDLFARFHDNELGSETDPDFMYIRPPEPASQKDKAWFIAEVFFHFDTAEGASKENVYKFFLPFLTLRLPLEFSDLQWWDTDNGESTKKKSAIATITDFIKSKF
ncbi:hypothetical protein [Maridesulfovibrio hydrothermalis]|uniref:Uncharacterized protein n=1 Tax=Maridesulfovibrio hydrothermalis AM13 = DSM 14728 TaxID=1121451 RepID=L0RGI4_9BACT|nr:hypothetical protein [Maridesulfovibrio hydrothermalis]CCO25325.1 conserved protein of unknown function [Maridesulfovibrio hydrothermalis AM13 = DSM 14728]